jgi:zinc transporter ZupT
LKLALQVPELLVQSAIPEGFELTLPLPETVTARLRGIGTNVAVTVRAWLIETTQVLVPEHTPPLQPSNCEPASGVAVNVTEVPSLKLALQVPELLVQFEIPEGFELTLPLPETVTARLR